jgi:hypothetical protein
MRLLSPLKIVWEQRMKKSSVAIQDFFSFPFSQSNKDAIRPHSLQQKHAFRNALTFLIA